MKSATMKNLPTMKVLKKLRQTPSMGSVTKIRRIVLPKKKENYDLRHELNEPTQDHFDDVDEDNRP